MAVFLTPAKQGQLDHVVSDVGVEHFDQKQVHVQCFNGHPGEAAQQAVLYHHGHEHADALDRPAGCPLAKQKAGVEEQQGGTQRYMDAVGGVCGWGPLRE